jgi:hypothetical protein
MVDAMSLKRESNGDLTLSVEGITNTRYLRAMAAREPGASDRAKRLLDGYVKAYDQRQRYSGSSIATDADVDAAYNAMLVREREREKAFIRYITTTERGGLGKPGLRKWAEDALASCVEMPPERTKDRERERRIALQTISALERQAPDVPKAQESGPGEGAADHG